MVELDLNEILQDTHTDLFTVDQVTGQCSCGEYVSQVQVMCTCCGEEISWKGSKVYNERYLVAETTFNPGVKGFLEEVGVQKFKNGREYHRWRRAMEVLPEDFILGVIAGCRQHLKSRGRVTGRAVMSYTLNSLEQNLKEKPTVKEGEILGRVGDPD